MLRNLIRRIRLWWRYGRRGLPVPTYTIDWDGVQNTVREHWAPLMSERTSADARGDIVIPFWPISNGEPTED